MYLIISFSIINGIHSCEVSNNEDFFILSTNDEAEASGASGAFSFPLVLIMALLLLLGALLAKESLFVLLFLLGLTWFREFFIPVFHFITS